MQWRYDENRTSFRPAAPGEIEADPDALYIIQRGDVLMVREEGQERPMPERLEVAGVTFDREQFECLPIPSRYLSKAEADSLRDEMRKDGQWAREQLQARERPEIKLPLELPLYVTKSPLTIEDMNEIAAAGWAGELDFSVEITREGEQLIARLSGGRVVRHHDAVALAELLLAAGVTADDVQMPDWREGDSAPSTGQRIAIFQRMRQGA